MSDLTPTMCIMACGHKYKYAAVNNGVHCLCSNIDPAKKVGEEHCSASCNGTAAWPKVDTFLFIKDTLEYPESRNMNLLAL